MNILSGIDASDHYNGMSIRVDRTINYIQCDLLSTDWKFLSKICTTIHPTWFNGRKADRGLFTVGQAILIFYWLSCHFHTLDYYYISL